MAQVMYGTRVVLALTHLGNHDLVADVRRLLEAAKPRPTIDLLSVHVLCVHHAACHSGVGRGPE